MEQKVKNVHWFPGHMKKISIELESKIKLVDFVIHGVTGKNEVVSPAASLDTLNISKCVAYIYTVGI